MSDEGQTSFEIALVPEGIQTERWIPPVFERDVEGEIVSTVREGRHEYEIEKVGDVFELLRFWHFGVSRIADDFTLGDLFRIFRECKGFSRLGPMLACDVEAFLAESAKEGKRESDLDFLEVYNCTDLENYVEDEANPDAPFDVKAGEWHGGRMNGNWIGPYNFSRDFHGWGTHTPDENEGGGEPYKTGYGLSFTPPQDLLHTPLRYDPKLSFLGDWHRKVCIERQENPQPEFECEIGITFGELVHAIFWEIGWHGGPASRDEFGSQLQETVREARAQLAAEDAQKNSPPTPSESPSSSTQVSGPDQREKKQ
jgi:hypothetical protein